MKRNEHICLFIFFALVCGILDFFRPPLSVSDSALHFYRTYQISTGQFVSQSVGEKIGGYIPKEYQDFVWLATSGNIHQFRFVDNLLFSSYFWQRPEPDYSDLVFVQFASSALYSPVVYLPYSVGLAVGRVFHLNVVQCYLLSAIFGFLSYVLIVTAALAIAPLGIGVISLIALTPSALGQVIAPTADIMTNACLLLYVAYVLRIRDSRSYVGKKELSILCLFAAVLALIKPAYVPFILLFFVIPKEKFQNIINRYVGFALTFLVAVTVTFFWLYCIDVQKAAEYYGCLSDGKSRIISMLGPSKLVSILVRNFREFSFNTLRQMVGFRWYLHQQLSIPFVFISLLAFWLVALVDTSKEVVLMKMRTTIVFIGVAAVVALCIMVSLTIVWGEHQGTGMQGRYLLPCAFLFLLAVSQCSPLQKVVQVQKWRLPVVFVCLLFFSFVHLLNVAAYSNFKSVLRIPELKEGSFELKDACFGNVDLVSYFPSYKMLLIQGWGLTGAEPNHRLQLTQKNARFIFKNEDYSAYIDAQGIERLDVSFAWEQPAYLNSGFVELVNFIKLPVGDYEFIVELTADKEKCFLKVPLLLKKKDNGDCEIVELKKGFLDLPKNKGL